MRVPNLCVYIQYGAHSSFLSTIIVPVWVRSLVCEFLREMNGHFSLFSRARGVDRCASDKLNSGIQADCSPIIDRRELSSKVSLSCLSHRVSILSSYFRYPAGDAVYLTEKRKRRLSRTVSSIDKMLKILAFKSLETQVFLRANIFYAREM